MLWLNGPVGTGAEHRVLRLGCRTILVVVPFVVAGTRLMDVLASGIGSRPGKAGSILRQTMYCLLDLPEPARGVRVSPVPLPEPVKPTEPTGDAS